MVTITGDTPGCAGDTCPQMTIAVTDHFQLITLTGFTDLSSVTISQQTITARRRRHRLRLAGVR